MKGVSSHVQHWNVQSNQLKTLQGVHLHPTTCWTHAMQQCIHSNLRIVGFSKYKPLSLKNGFRENLQSYVFLNDLVFIPNQDDLEISDLFGMGWGHLSRNTFEIFGPV